MVWKMTDNESQRCKSIQTEIDNLRTLLTFTDRVNAKTNVGLWFETGNSLYLNRAVEVFESAEIECPGLLNDEVYGVGRTALRGTKIASSEPKYNRSNSKAQAMPMVANMIYNGLTLDSASAKAATLYQWRYPNLPRYPASGIERDYTDSWRNTGFEAECFLEWDNRKTLPAFEKQYLETQQTWQKIIEETPNAEGALKGNRHDG